MVSFVAGFEVVSGSSSVFNGKGFASSFLSMVRYAPNVGLACCELVFAQPDPSATFVLAKKYRYLPLRSHTGEIASAIGSLNALDFLLSTDHTMIVRKLLGAVFI